MGLMSKREENVHSQFFRNTKVNGQPPDLLIYLKASVPTLVAINTKNGGEYEEKIYGWII